MKKLLSILVIAVIFAGCTATESVKNTDGTTSQKHVVDPRLQQFDDNVKLVSPVIPTPWGWIASAAAGIAVSVSQTVANHKNKKSANQWEDVATTIIQGVEAAGDAASAVKKSIAERSKTDGNANLVNDVVQKELT